MEASVRTGTGTGTARKLDSEKAQRIVSAMRASVGARGAAGATFDTVAQQAGVSRGLLHYYFGSKERLLVEVVRHDCDIRLADLEQRLAKADSVDGIVDVLVSHLEDFLDQDQAAGALVYELFTASRHNEDLQEAMAELYREIRSHVTNALEEKQREGVVELRGEPAAVASILFALGDGMALQRLSDPAWDSSKAYETGMSTARFLLGA